MFQNLWVSENILDICLFYNHNKTVTKNISFEYKVKLWCLYLSMLSQLYKYISLYSCNYWNVNFIPSQIIEMGCEPLLGGSLCYRLVLHTEIWIKLLYFLLISSSKLYDYWLKNYAIIFQHPFAALDDINFYILFDVGWYCIKCWGCKKSCESWSPVSHESWYSHGMSPCLILIDLVCLYVNYTCRSVDCIFCLYNFLYSLIK